MNEMRIGTDLVREARRNHPEDPRLLILDAVASYRRSDLGRAETLLREALDRTSAAWVRDRPEELRALRVWPWYPIFDCRPDIIFRVTQDCGQGDEIVFAADVEQQLLGDGPVWWYAAGIATRPRGVRAIMPCWMRNGS